MSTARAPAGAVVGFTVKSGWASAVLLTGSVMSPRVLDTRRVDLSDPASPESRQPYHDGFGTARSSGRELSRLVTSVERFGKQSVTGLLRHYKTQGHRLLGAGIVVGSLIEPERIGNEHIRIHTLEGRLFRRVVEDAAARGHLACAIWRERDLYPVAAATIRQTEQELRGMLTTLGRTVAGSWRAEQKAAALAAWLVLAGGVHTAATARGRWPAA
jgi:hypothetical protein